MKTRELELIKAVDELRERNREIRCQLCREYKALKDSCINIWDYLGVEKA